MNFRSHKLQFGLIDTFDNIFVSFEFEGTKFFPLSKSTIRAEL